MAKDKSSAATSSKDAKAAAKAERKAAKSALKAEKLAKKGGVTKPKKEKKDKEKRKALAERALNEMESKKEADDEDEEGGDEDEDEEGDMDVSGVKVGRQDEEEGEEGEAESDDDEDTKEAASTLKKAKADPGKLAKKEGMVEEKKKILATRPVGALVPFANPLVDEKAAKKVFKCVKKAAAHRTLKRGVKEVVKALRKSPADSASLSVGVVILAADISPMDVISHIPVLAEDHHIPYIYVTSRAELGIAGMTKRPTSVVIVSRDVGKKGEAKKDEDGDKETWEETYKGLVKVVEREGRHVKV